MFCTFQIYVCPWCVTRTNKTGQQRDSSFFKLLSTIFFVHFGGTALAVSRIVPSQCCENFGGCEPRFSQHTNFQWYLRYHLLRTEECQHKPIRLLLIKFSLAPLYFNFNMSIFNLGTEVVKYSKVWGFFLQNHCST